MHYYLTYMAAQEHQRDLRRAALAARPQDQLPSRPSPFKRLFTGLGSRSPQATTVVSAAPATPQIRPKSA